MLRRIRAGFALVGALLLSPTAANAADGDLGVSVGGMVAGTVPRLSISPHAGVSADLGGLRLGVRDMCSILPAVDVHGIGVYNHLSATLGYAWPAGDINIGPSFGVFTMPVCGVSQCARMNGIAPGGTAQASLYFAGHWGASARVNVDWMSEAGGVLPANAVVVVVAGPVLRWSTR